MHIIYLPIPCLGSAALAVAGSAVFVMGRQRVDFFKYLKLAQNAAIRADYL